MVSRTVWAALGLITWFAACAGPVARAPAPSNPPAPVPKPWASKTGAVVPTALKSSVFPPGFDASVPQMPKLAADIIVDGKAKEWKGAVSIPLRSRFQRVEMTAGHSWNGIDDLSAEAWFGWTQKGIAVAVVVRDDDVGNRRNDSELSEEDAVEIFVDGRPGAALSSRRYGRGAYHVITSAPTKGKPKRVVIAGDQEIEGLEVAAARSRGGYTVEALFPWSAFEGMSPGSGKMGLAFQVDEHDRRDGKRGRTVTLANPAIRDHSRSPASFETWQLVDQVLPGGLLGSQLVLDGPAVWGEESPNQLVVQVGAALAGRIHTVRLVSPLEHAPAPVENHLAVVVPRAADWFAGRMRFVTEARDAQGRVVGVGSSSVINLGEIIRASLDSVRAADLHSRPFQGAAWLGAAAALARLREDIATQNLDWVEPRQREVRTRIALLEGRPCELDRAHLHDLLVLGTDPETEIVVEYPAPKVATVTFVYGSIPLGSVRVTPHKGAVSAVTTRVERTTVLGNPAAVGDQWGHWELIDQAAIDPARNVFVWYPKEDRVSVVPPGEVDRINADCRVELGPGAKVSTSLPEVSLEEASSRGAVLVVGDPRPIERFARVEYQRVFMRSGATRIALAAKGRLLEVVAPSHESAELMLRAVLGAEPVTLAQVDELRQSVVRTIAARVKPAPARFQTGDLHMHSFCSDGKVSPTSLMLQAMYAGMSYAVLTDHNTLRCALYLQNQLGEHGFSYPALVGEEFTAAYHAVIFPLRDALLPPMESRELTEKAHALGAFVQWNHPTHTAWGMEHYGTGLRGLGFDAWEHFPPRYEAWQRQGMLPVLTGTTDTHTGAFGNPPERTLVFTDSAEGIGLAAALRKGRAVAILPLGGKLFYGPPAQVRQAQAALAEGNALRTLRAERLRTTLANAKLADLVLASPTDRAGVPTPP